MVVVVDDVGVITVVVVVSLGHNGRAYRSVHASVAFGLRERSVNANGLVESIYGRQEDGCNDSGRAESRRDHYTDTIVSNSEYISEVPKS